MELGYRAVDADNHYYETLDACTRHLPKEFKQRGVQVIHVTHTAPPVSEVTQITSDWDYRPRGEIRRKVALDCEREGTPDVVGPSTPNENDDVWFNFTNAKPTVEKATISGS